MRSVYFIQSKFPSNPIELNALINRWEIYAEKIREKTQIRVITIVSLGSMIPLQKEFIGLRSFSKKPNFFSNLYLVVKEINSSDVKATLVAGDNQLSFIFCLIGKILSISKIRVQIQFHGDIYSYSKVGGFRGVVRVLTSRIALRFADSVRIVSQFQESEIQNITKRKMKEFVLAPIPIDYSKIPNESELSDNFDIALVGRLQVERGVLDAVFVLKKLVSALPNIRIVIVGDGPLRGLVLESLKKEIESGSVHLLGPLFHADLRAIYAQTRILLSMAPSEGYGLALREAALSGMRVIARDSNGARGAFKEFPNSITLFDSLEEAIQIIPSILNKDRSPWGYQEFKEKQQKRDIKALDKLIESWIIN